MALRFFKEFVLPHRTVVALLILNILVRVGVGFWWPYASKTMVDRVLANSVPAWTVATTVILVGYVMFTLNHALVFLFNRVLFRLLVVVTQRTRTRLADHLLKLSQKFYDAAHAGRLLTTAVGDPGAITQVMTAGMINALANVFIVLGGYVILLNMNVPLTLAISAVFPGMIVAFFILRPKMVTVSERIRENWGIIGGMVAEKIGAVRVVRSFAAEDLEGGRFRKRVEYHRDLHVEYNRYVAAYGLVNGLSIHLGYLIVFVAGGWFHLTGSASLGTVVAFYGYFSALWPAVLQVCNVPQLIAQASGSLTKVFRLLDEPLAIASPDGAPRLAEPVREIAFEHVSFRYAPDLPWALRRVTLRVRAGEQVGLLGPSGSGKSTLLALMLRYYDPTEGRVLVNGRDLKEWDLSSVRRAFGLVPQEMILFSGPVRENILYGWSEPWGERSMNSPLAGSAPALHTQEARDDAAVRRALALAEAAAFVDALPKGLDTEIGERGVSLSGGQKQRLSIARALLAEPEVLVLDNCTSALDGETERRLLGALREVSAGRTALIVSHRVASVLHCGRVLVMDAGRIVEDGAPGALTERGGYFADIRRQQEGVQGP